ncbi:RDD family protein [Actinomadura chibensis]|uniref:RDD family protein n=1 Tax=Actinomadura chibensis TaxID=392828 RepID=A0A5D0NR10_9ACTN|nr:RDD family protein [Actinomadura chibensis]TYB46531.1 RDD family protein [Actinomadura chibensis]
MSEPPENPRPEGGGWASPDPRSPEASETPSPDVPETASPDAPTGPPATPERPPPYQGTYGAQPGAAPLPAAPPIGYGPPAPAPGHPQQPGYPPPGYAHPGHVPPGYGPPGHGGPRDFIAGRAHRLAAGILDSLLLSLFATPVVLLSIRWDKWQDSVSSGEPITDPLDLYNIPRMLAGYAFVFLLGFVYFTVAHAKWGQTLGKKALGIRLVRASDHSAVSLGRAAGRQAVVYAITMGTSAVSLLSPALGILSVVGLLDNAWILWDQRRQALHDKAAGTVVVKAAPWMPNPYARSAPPPPAPSGPGNS